MVDMHMHTNYSDGVESLETVLTKCEEKGLEYISITDHNTCKEYDDDVWKKNIYAGKVIIGAEMNATLDDGKKIEFLAYNIKKTEIINEWSQKFFSKEILTKKFEESKKRALNMCDKAGLIYNLDNIKKDIPVTDFFVVYLYFEIIKYPENVEKLGEMANSFNSFRRNGLDNPESIFYTGEDKSEKPMFRDVAKVIHDAGALLFVAHPYEYKFEDTLSFLDYLRNEIKVDGIECFHPSANGKYDILVKYARDNNLFISGGSDFHGAKKPGIELGIGDGSLNISREYVDEWINN